MSNYGATRAVAVLSILLFLGHVVRGQQTTNTNCNVYGSTVNCTSNTTDNAAQQQRSYEAGQQVGNALGQGIAGAMQAHSFSKGLRKYCDVHPGEVWHYGVIATGQAYNSGTCPTNEEKSVQAANKFMSHHKEFIPEPANSNVLVAYLEAHKLDPREEKSYERAYKDLKKSGKLDLYAK